MARKSSTKAIVIMCNSQWDIDHTLMCINKLETCILNGKSILREKALSGKEGYAQIKHRKITSKKKKCSGCMLVKNFQGLSELIYYWSLSSRAK